MRIAARFWQQVRWTLAVSFAAMCLGVVLAFVTVFLEAYAIPVWPDVSGFMSMVLISAGAMLTMVGAVVRPLQRMAILHGIPAGDPRGRLLRSRFMRWWLWVDEAGKNRDSAF